MVKVLSPSSGIVASTSKRIRVYSPLGVRTMDSRAEVLSTWAAIQGEIFEEPAYGCAQSGCHSPPIRAGLNLSHDVAYDNLVGVPATRSFPDSLDRVTAGEPAVSFLIRKLEGTLAAGQGTAIGYRFEQLESILDATRDPGAFGICLDTCHLFAAGYDFRTPEGYASMIDELDRRLGVSNVKCIHMNDSKRDVGSRVDRHEHIGKGKIGKRGFAQ